MIDLLGACAEELLGVVLRCVDLQELQELLHEGQEILPDHPPALHLRNYEVQNLIVDHPMLFVLRFSLNAFLHL